MTNRYAVLAMLLVATTAAVSSHAAGPEGEAAGQTKQAAKEVKGTVVSPRLAASAAQRPLPQSGAGTAAKRPLGEGLAGHKIILPRPPRLDEIISTHSSTLPMQGQPVVEPVLVEPPPK